MLCLAKEKFIKYICVKIIRHKIKNNLYKFKLKIRRLLKTIVITICGKNNTPNILYFEKILKIIFIKQSN